MEGIRLDADPRQILIGDLDSRRIDIGIQLGLNGQSLLRRRVTDEIDDHLVADQRSASPVLRDMRKHAVLDLVPFAGSRREVAHRYSNPGLVGQSLQGDVPKTRASTIAATAIRQDEKFFGFRIRRRPHVPPPAMNRFGSELGRVVVGTDADPSAVAGHVIDPVGNRFAQLLVEEVMHPHGLG
jgi:hypothetical protein